eukprot:219402-Alexandrium_andersonii.AAC.1
MDVLEPLKAPANLAVSGSPTEEAALWPPSPDSLWPCSLGPQLLHTHVCMPSAGSTVVALFALRAPGDPTAEPDRTTPS